MNTFLHCFLPGPTTNVALSKGHFLNGKIQTQPPTKIKKWEEPCFLHTDPQDCLSFDHMRCSRSSNIYKSLYSLLLFLSHFPAVRIPSLTEYNCFLYAFCSGITHALLLPYRAFSFFSSRLFFYSALPITNIHR